MDYNRALENTIDHHLIDREDITKKKEMGGVSWLIRGNMCCGIYEQLLVLRLNPRLVDEVVSRPGISTFGNRTDDSRTVISLTAAVYSNRRALALFLRKSVAYTETLPARSPSDSPHLSE